MGNVLNLIYNNYLTTYSPRTIDRYDSHKKSELRSVYSGIVKTGRDTPWFLRPSVESTNLAIKLKEEARALGSAVFDAGGNSEGILDKKVAYCTDNSVAEAKYIGDEDAPEETHILEVKSMADRQENLGLFLSDRPVALEADMYSFNVAINGMNYEFQFSIGEEETNLGVQNRLNNLINNSNIGIHSQILDNDRRHALMITSDQTGTSRGGNVFAISDDNTGKRSGAVEYFGIGFVSKEPRDATVVLDGRELTARANEFTIDKQYEVTLKRTTLPGESVEIGLKNDLESLMINTEKLLDGFNNFVDSLNEGNNVLKTSKISSELNAISELYADAMNAVGIERDESGRMSLNRQTFREYAEGSEDLRKDISFIKDYSEDLLRKSSQISLNPMEYVNKTVVAYKNPGRSFVSSYNSSIYAGMMFNNYC